MSTKSTWLVHSGRFYNDQKFLTCCSISALWQSVKKFLIFAHIQPPIFFYKNDRYKNQRSVQIVVDSRHSSTRTPTSSETRINLNSRVFENIVWSYFVNSKPLKLAQTEKECRMHMFTLMREFTVISLPIKFLKERSYIQTEKLQFWCLKCTNFEVSSSNL